MKLDETTLIEIQDYIDALDEKVGLKPETVEDVRKAIDKHRTELKNLRIAHVSGSFNHETISKIRNSQSDAEARRIIANHIKNYR